MYLLKQQSLIQSQVAPATVKVVPDCNASIGMDTSLPPGFQPPYQTNPDIHTIAIFIQITWVLWFLFIVVMMCRGIYSRFGNADDSSDAESDITESAWRGEDSTLPPPLVASKHRKRLKKLQQVAPSQSLQHWRAEKSEEHIQTFATVSLTLSCAVCLESLEDNDQIRELRCGHVYHADCLSLWVERGHHDCPLCKYDMLGLKTSKSKAHLSVSRSATRTNLNTAATQEQDQERGGPAEDVIIQIDDESDDSGIIDDDSDDDDL